MKPLGFRPVVVVVQSSTHHTQSQFMAHAHRGAVWIHQSMRCWFLPFLKNKDTHLGPYNLTTRLSPMSLAALDAVVWPLCMSNSCRLNYTIVWRSRGVAPVASWDSRWYSVLQAVHKRDMIGVCTRCRYTNLITLHYGSCD